MNSRHYILDENNRVIATDLYTWARWFQDAQNRLVEQTTVSPSVFVSTVFLGLDHDFSGKGPPVLWETMVFRNGNGDDCYRCAGSWEQAHAQHVRVVTEETLNL